MGYGEKVLNARQKLFGEDPKGFWDYLLRTTAHGGTALGGYYQNRAHPQAMPIVNSIFGNPQQIPGYQPLPGIDLGDEAPINPMIHPDLQLPDYQGDWVERINLPGESSLGYPGEL